jgi:hypothetical protein
VLADFWRRFRALALSDKGKKLLFVYCVVIVLFDTFVRSLTIISATALAIAILPWLLKFVKSIKMPGGFELEMNRLEDRIEAELPKANLPPAEQHLFVELYASDPLLALAGLRIEIEKRLRRIAENNQINTKGSSLGSLVRELQKRELLGHNVASIINDMLPTINRAVHAQDVPADASDWVIKNGPSLLAALDDKV